jgi:hypothetical protein
MNDRGKVDAEYFEDVHVIHFCGDLLTLGSLVQTEMTDHRYYYA